MSVTRHPTALYHMVVSFGLMPTCFFPAKPNAPAQPLPKAGAQRTLEVVGCSGLLGLSGHPCQENADARVAVDRLVCCSKGI